MSGAPRSTVLVTGFGPFADVSENASGRVAEQLGGTIVAGHVIVGVVLPTAFGVARERIASLVAEHQPAAVVALGVSGDTSARLERVAGARVLSTRPDVHGEDWSGRRLGDFDLHVGPDFGRWLAAAQAFDGDVRASEDCGGYVCNALFHALLTAAAAVPAVFMHIPRALDVSSIDRMAGVARVVACAMVES